MKLIVSLGILLISFQSFNCHHGRSISTSRLDFFDIELLRYAVEDKPGNIMVSPACVKTTLAMLLEGSKGDTAIEIRNALRLSSHAMDRKMEIITYLQALNQNTTSTMLQSANGVFVSKKLTLKKDFETAVKTDFFSELSKIDFDDSKKASDQINTWVSEKTKGLIQNILEKDQLSSTSQVVLVNALYFKSTWKYSFDPLHTHPDCFYRSDKCEKVTMMELETELPYAYVEDLRAHALELPYEGGRYSMVMLLPMEPNGCDALIRDLPFLGLAKIHDLMHRTEVTLSMPKFTVNYNGDMMDPLKKMHINSLFSSKSNLSGIFQGSSANVNSFQHKVFLSVDEAGTVAAAVSAAVVVPLSFSGVEIKVDKPFVFFIRDNDLGIVLFEGKIDEPTAYVEAEKPQTTDTPKSTTVVESAKPTASVEIAKPAAAAAPAKPVVPGAPAKPLAFIEPAGPEAYVPVKFPANNDLNDLLLPTKVMKRENFDTHTIIPTTTTEKPKGFFASVKNFFG